MANPLATLLIESRAVSADALERARAHQLDRGGSLDTALLELDLVGFAELAELLSRATGLPPPPPAEAWSPDPLVRRALPARIAALHRLAPLRIEDGALHALVALPVDEAALDELAFMLSHRLVLHAAPEYRVREVQALLYGEALPDRFAVLALRAVEAAREPAAAPPPVWPGLTEAGPAGEEGRGVASAEDGEDRPADDDEELVFFPTVEGEGSSPFVDPEAPSPRGGAVAPTAAPPPDLRRWPGPPEPGAAPRQEAASLAGRPRWHLEPEEPLAFALAAAGEESEPGVVVELPAVGAPAGGEPSPVPWSREEALAALASAPDRDGVVAAALRCAAGTFEAAAIFAIGRGRVVGQDAAGWEGGRERVRAIQREEGRLPALLRAALEARAPWLGPPGREAGNAALLDGMGRPWPGTALVFPVVVRERPVALLYADDGGGAVSGKVSDLLSCWAEVGPAFERVLRTAKRLRALAPPFGAPGAVAGGALGALPGDAPEAQAAPSPAWEAQEPARGDGAPGAPARPQTAAERWTTRWR